jgi:hypothetical protein
VVSLRVAPPARRHRDLAGAGAEVRAAEQRVRKGRTIAALLALRDHVIAPILAGVRSPCMGRKPAHWTRIDRDYETLRIGMHALFHDVGIETLRAAA